MQRPKRPAEELAEMIRDGLAEEGFEVRVHSNPRTGWDVAISSDKATEGAQLRAEAIAIELRQSYDLEA
jgi:flavodoxin